MAAASLCPASGGGDLIDLARLLVHPVYQLASLATAGTSSITRNLIHSPPTISA